MQEPSYQAVLIVSFGGPEKPDDVLPFLENVVRGRNVPRQRLLEVAEHYYGLGGVSPINARNRELAAALETELAQNGPKLPVYLGNRNWHPLLADTLREMARDGVRRALAFVTSAYSSYSGCRQYLDNIAAAREEVGTDAPGIDKLRVFYNHPGFIEAVVARIASATQQLPAERREDARLVFTAHSIPTTMARLCEYENQLRESCRLVASDLGHGPWDLVFQSRSGRPSQPWLEPDVCDHLHSLADAGDVRDVVLVPIGFLTDHIEVLYDLDKEAGDVASQRGLNLVRAESVGCHPRFVRMIRELIVERTTSGTVRAATGKLGPCHDVCPSDCCPSGRDEAKAAEP